MTLQSKSFGRPVHYKSPLNSWIMFLFFAHRRIIILFKDLRNALRSWMMDPIKNIGSVVFQESEGQLRNNGGPLGIGANPTLYAQACVLDSSTTTTTTPTSCNYKVQTLRYQVIEFGQNLYVQMVKAITQLTASLSFSHHYLPPSHPSKHI